MVDVVTSPQILSPAMQYYQLAGLDAPDESDGLDDSGFLINDTPASLVAMEPASTQTGNIDGLLSLSTPIVSLFNEVQADSASAIPGSLSSEQLQELDILQQDMLALEEGIRPDTTMPLTNNATTVDLSVAAQAAVASENVAANPAAAASAEMSFTPAQLDVIKQIITPLANEPLTPAALLDVQSQLAQNQFSPLEISLITLLIAQNYAGGMQSPGYEAIESRLYNRNKDAVAPILATTAIAVEDGALTM